MKRLKKAFSIGWRAALCLALLFWVFNSIFSKEGHAWADGHNLQWDQLSRNEQIHLAWTKGPLDLWHTMELFQPGALLLSTALVGVALWIGVLRWRLVLQTQGLELSLGRTARISLVAQFFNSFLLGSTGGDLIKAYYAARETHHLKTEAVTTVFVDRLVGLWAMLFFAGVMMLPNLQLILHNGKLAAPALAILAMLAILTVVLSVAFWGGVSKRFPRARHQLRRLPKGEVLERALDSCRQFGQKKGFLAKAVALSLAVNVVWVLQISVLAAGLNLSVPFQAFLVIVPVIFCISALPITLNGFGVREKLFVDMLEVLAVPGTAALSISLMSAAQGMLWSLIGGAVYFGVRQKEHLEDVTHETMDDAGEKR
jgi:uncharacterized protein (TIRG00374 family)